MFAESAFLLVILPEPGRTRTSNPLISPGMSQSLVFWLFPVSYLIVLHGSCEGFGLGLDSGVG
jgi:hypothetical protein